MYCMRFTGLRLSKPLSPHSTPVEIWLWVRSPPVWAGSPSGRCSKISRAWMPTFIIDAIIARVEGQTCCTWVATQLERHSSEMWPQALRKDWTTSARFVTLGWKVSSTEKIAPYLIFLHSLAGLFGVEGWGEETVLKLQLYHNWFMKWKWIWITVKGFFLYNVMFLVEDIRSIFFVYCGSHSIQTTSCFLLSLVQVCMEAPTFYIIASLCLVSPSWGILLKVLFLYETDH